MLQNADNEMDGPSLKELNTSFEDFKELVPKVADRLKMKKYIRDDCMGTISTESTDTSIVSVTTTPSRSDSDIFSDSEPGTPLDLCTPAEDTIDTCGYNTCMF